MKTVQLSCYNNTGYKSGGRIQKILWYFTNVLFFKTLIPFPSVVKVKLLRMFGAKVGHDVTIKPNVNIKYPWFLEIGDICEVTFTPNNVGDPITKYVEVIRIARRVDTEFNTVDLGFQETRYSPIVLDDTVFGKLDVGTLSW